MNKLFHLFIDQFLVIYLDNIVVYSINLEKHMQHLKQVFKVLCDSKLFIQLEKCSFAQREVEFLRHMTKDEKLMMDLAKVQAIQEWNPPTKVPKLRSFIGLVNYYHQFIKGYSTNIALSMELLKKNKE